VNRSRKGERDWNWRYWCSDCQKVERCGLSGENGKFETLLVAEKRAKMTDFVLKGFANGTLNPVIDKTFPLENIVEGIAILRATSMSGRSWSRLALSIVDEKGRHIALSRMRITKHIKMKAKMFLSLPGYCGTRWTCSC
jgi:hypothetical protein